MQRWLLWFRDRMRDLAGRLRAPESRWSVIVAATVAAVLVACTIAFALGRDEKGEPLAYPRADGTYYYAYLPSLWLDGDLDFTNQYAITKNWYRFGTTPVGRPSNVFGIGPAVFESPFFLAGHAVVLASDARDDGFSNVEQALVGWASVLASVLSIVFAYRVARRRIGNAPASLLAALLVFAGGPVLYYAIRQPGYAHPFATFFAAWLVDAWDASHERERTGRTWAYLGALLGCAILVRPQLVTWAALLVASGVSDLVAARRSGTLKTVVGHLVLGVVVAFAVVVPQLLAWKAIYGDYYLVPQGEQFMRWDEPAWTEVLFSSRNGLFPWSPIYLFGCVGLFIGVWSSRRLFGWLLFGVVAQAFVNGAAWDWWAGGSFGGRRFDSTYLAFAAGTAVVLTRAWTHVGALRRGPARIRGVTVAVASLVTVGLLIWLTVANIALISKSTRRNARIHGGQPAADVLRKRLGVVGVPAAWASRVSNLPARIAFALRHQTDLTAYDRIVGVHWLGETYPGLNSNPVKREDRREMKKVGKAFREGFVACPGVEGLVLEKGRGRVFIGLNRRGAVSVTVTALDASGGSLALYWNGTPVRRADLRAHLSPITFEVDEPRRGVNRLELHGTAQTAVVSIELRSLSPF